MTTVVRLCPLCKGTGVEPLSEDRYGRHGKPCDYCKGEGHLEEFKIDIVPDYWPGGAA